MPKSLVDVRNVLAVVREPAGLARLCLVAQPDNDVTCWRVWYLDGSGDHDLDAAFAALSRYEVGAAADERRLLDVMRATLVSPRAPRAQPPRRALSGAPAPRASAAHPRAFRGTKSQPPKPARVTLDVRPLSGSWTVLARSLRLAGRDPYLEAHHPGAPDDATLLDLGSRFLLCLGPLRGTPWSELTALVGAHHQLLRAEVVGEVDLARAAHALAAETLRQLWTACASLPVETARAAHAEALAGAPGRALRDDGLAAGILRVAAACAAREPAASGTGLLADALQAFFAGVGHGASCEHAAGVVELFASQIPTSWGGRFPYIAARRDDPSAWVRAHLPAFVAGPDEAPRDPDDARARAQAAETHRVMARLHDALGLDEARIALEELAAATHLEAAERAAWLDVFAAFAWSYRAERVWSRSRTNITTLLRDTLEGQRRVRGRHVHRVVSTCLWDEDGDAALSDLDVAIIRQAAGHHEAVWRVLNVLGEALGAPVTLERAGLDRLASVVPSGRKLQLACAGLWSLAEAWPESSAWLTANHPAALLATAARLGVLPRARAYDLLVGVAQHALFARPGAIDPLLCEALARRRRNPVPRALRDHHTAGRALTPGQLRRHTERVAADWDLLRLDLAKEALDALLAEPLERVDDAGAETDRAALRLALETYARRSLNRRAFRKMLPRWLAGERDAVFSHPASLAWFARHPSIDADAWREGIVVSVLVAGVGMVCFAFERDPLSALRLGELGGTCLALGGVCEDDAAGVVLDANKRVVYARGPGGEVIGRQLVALSEDGRLVCHPVYPESVEDVLGDAFECFDHDLSDFLGIPLVRTDDYERASILSRRLWDDGVWPRLTRNAWVR
ncbi:MAG: hypothetical protein R3B40_04125 [Polyangiales bacterium]